MKLLRVLRGMVGTAVVWGLAWIPLTAGVFAALNLFEPGVPYRFWTTFVFGASFRGAICGALFAGVLSVVARRRSFAELTFPQLMACGAAGAIIGPGLTLAIGVMVAKFAIPPGVIAVQLLMSAGLGAVCAAGTLYAARRAPELPGEAKLAIDGPPTVQAVR